MNIIYFWNNFVIHFSRSPRKINYWRPRRIDPRSWSPIHLQSFRQQFTRSAHIQIDLSPCWPARWTCDLRIGWNWTFEREMDWLQWPFRKCAKFWMENYPVFDFETWIVATCRSAWWSADFWMSSAWPVQRKTYFETSNYVCGLNK